jgi:hypothetical protein
MGISVMTEKTKADKIADFSGMTFCVMGSILLMAYPGLAVFVVFLFSCICFGYVAIRNSLWGMFSAQAICFITNIIGIVRVLNGTWG